MFFHVLTKNLNQESLTKNLVTFIFNIMVFSKNSDSLGGGSIRIKRGEGVDSLQVQESWAKRGQCSLYHFGRQGACHDITKSPDSQNKKIFRQRLHDCRNSTKIFYQTNDYRLRIVGKKKVFEKTQNGRRHMLVASHSSRNRFLVIEVKICTEPDLSFLVLPNFA